MNKKSVLLGAALLLGAATASAQSRVTGRVTDSHGDPVMGATVRVAGTKILTTTDENGAFTLNNVPASAKRLDVSYIGMQNTTVNVAGNVSVVLRDNELQEAVVVGYGTAKKLGTIVGSVKKVGGDIVENKPATNIADALQGQVSGMQVLNNTGDVGAFNNVSIQIRGAGSVSASTTPLIVVDGSPAGTSILSMLGPDDIESVTTLKDASATSIYGSRAANGVIYITTKKGRNSEKAQVVISQSMGWSQLARGIGNPMNADELLDFQLENGIIYPSNYAEYKAHGANTNWMDYIFSKHAPMYNTNFSVRGGNERTTYFVSGSYMKQSGVSQQSSMKRTTLRTNLETQVNDWMKMGVNQSIAYSENHTTPYASTATNALYAPSTISSTFPAYWDPFDPEARANHEILHSGGVSDPLYAWAIQPSYGKNVLYNGNAFIQLNPIKGLTLRSQLGLYATNSLTNSKVMPSGASIFSTTGQASSSVSQGSTWTITNTAEYNFTLGEDHDITLLAGQEGIKSDSYGFSASVSGLQDDRLTLLSSGVTPEAPSESKSKYEYLSFFGRVDYGFKKKYYANFTVRSDASSRFGKSNRTALFYSGGVMWDMMQENFMKPASSWLTALQLKVSVGSTGNSEVGNYGHLALAGETNYGGSQGWYLGQFANSELGWEKQIQSNVGFTASFFGRINLDVNLYNRKTKNMLMSMPLPYTTGMSSIMSNIGEMTNRGIEVDLSYDIVHTRDWYVNFHATYGYNHEKMDKLFYGIDEWPQKSSLIYYAVGKGLNYYMPIYAGIDENDGAPMWYKVGYSGEPGYTYNPETMTKDESQIEDLYQDTGKKVTAPHTGGFGFQVSWKGLSLVADFSYVLGKYMVDNAYFLNTASSTATQGYNMDKDALDMWKKPGDHSKLPAFKYDSQFDTHLLQNSSFMRLKNLTLSYDLPKAWVKKTGFIENFRLTFNGRNLFTVTKYTGADPEVNSNITVGNYPATRQYTIGAEVTF